jgi:dihydroorotase-like cyclic amidohydrolase
MIRSPKRRVRTMYLIRNAHLINDGSVCTVDVRIRAGHIAQIGPMLSNEGETLIDARGLHLLPGMIAAALDTPHSASESRAAITGGITCFLSPSDSALDAIPHEHALPALMEQVHCGALDLPALVRAFAHAPADHANLGNRGYVREGYIADLVLIDVYRPYQVDGRTYRSQVMHTFVRGHLAYSEGRYDETTASGGLEIT